MSKVDSVIKAFDRAIKSLDDDLSHDIYDKTDEKYIREVISRYIVVADKLSDLLDDTKVCVEVSTNLECAEKSNDKVERLNKELQILTKENKHLKKQISEVNKDNKSLRKQNKIITKNYELLTRQCETLGRQCELLGRDLELANKPKKVEQQDPDLYEVPNNTKRIVKTPSNKYKNYKYFDNQAEAWMDVADVVSTKQGYDSRARYVVQYLYKTLKYRFVDYSAPISKDSKKSYYLRQVPGVLINLSLLIAQKGQGAPLMKLISDTFKWFEEIKEDPTNTLLMPVSLMSKNISNKEFDKECILDAYNIWKNVVENLNEESKAEQAGVYVYNDQFYRKIKTLGIADEFTLLELSCDDK